MKISIPTSDLLKGMPIVPGWYKATITKAWTAPSKDGDSINHWHEYTLEDKDTRTIERSFNSKVLGFLRPMLAAVSGKSEAEFVEELCKANSPTLDIDDWEKFVGKKLQVKIENQIFEGRQIPKVVDYTYYDYKTPF